MEEHYKDNPIVYRSHFINALLPKFLSHLFWNLIILCILFAVYKLVDYSANYGKDYEFILYGICITVLFSVIKISKDIVKILSTSFIFHSNYVEVKFRLFHEKTHSISYKSISDIEIKKTIWDRICGVGDLVIHTANDEYLESDTKALILKDVKNPDKIKEVITIKIHR